MNVDDIFVAAVDIASPADRAAYLESACAGDDTLRREVDSLLAAHERIGGFLQKRPTLLARASAAFGVPPSGGAGPEPIEAEAAFAPSEQAGERIGHYKLLEKIGEGGMGVVWMAEQEEPVRRRVALKIIKLGMDTRSVVARFEAERQALALMDHPNIAKVFDGGATERPLPRPPGTLSPRGGKGWGEGVPAGRPYFVMELVRGLPITKYCDETKMQIRERLELFGQVCRAVQHAHQKGVIHRDLKPSNILVTEQDSRPVPKVIDFGIAKATEGRLTDKTLFTGFQQWLGTPAYMSPEQAGLGSLDIDTRSDVYSLGVVLYQLLTGHTPFDTQELLKSGFEAVLRTIREVEPPKPSKVIERESASRGERARTRGKAGSTLDPHLEPLSTDLDWIVMKCLEKDRNRRYETANALAADLDRYLHNDPVLARPPSTGYRLRKFVRKHRGPVAAVGGFVALLVAATAVSVGLALWANKERGRAENAQKSESAQRLAAEAERNRARDAEVEARTVLTFFRERVLAAARSRSKPGGLGREVTIRAALDAAEPMIARAFTNQPLVEASIRNEIGTTYQDLGEYRQAISQHERALELFRRQLGPDSEGALRVMNNLGLTYLDAGRPNDAVPLLEAAVKAFELKLGKDNQTTITAMLNLGSAYGDIERPMEELALKSNAVHLLRTKLAPDHPLVLDSTHMLAVTYKRHGQVNEAIALQEQVVELRKRKYGSTNPNTVEAIKYLATTCMDAGQYDRTGTLLRSVVEAARNGREADSRTYAESLTLLAECFFRQRKPEEALPLLSESLPILERTAPRSWVLTDTRSMMGGVLLRLGQVDGVEPLLLTAYAELGNPQLNVGGHYRATRMKDTARDLVYLYQKLGRPEDAAQWREKLGDPVATPTKAQP